MDKTLFKQLCLIQDIKDLLVLTEKKVQQKESYFLHKYGMTAEEVFNDKDIVVFGAGKMGMDIIRLLIKHNKKPVYICDNNPNKWGTFFEGVEIKPPDNLITDMNTVIVIISVVMSGSVCNQLEKMGIDYLYYDINGCIGYIAEPSLYKRKDDLIRVYEMFIDDFSRKVMLNNLKARLFPEIVFELSGSPFIHDITTGLQYFDRQYFTYSNNEVYVDCGVYDGDGIIEFCKTIYELQLNEPTIYGFEPDEVNYAKALAAVNKYGLNNVKLINAGVGHKNMNISPSQIYNCNNTQGIIEVRICRLDSMLLDIPISFIKMDIEGYELDALNGAQEIIKKYKPKLAISAYHYGRDIVDIPIFIKTLAPDYKIFLRHHCYHNLNETICYAFIEQSFTI